MRFVEPVSLIQRILVTVILTSGLIGNVVLAQQSMPVEVTPIINHFVIPKGTVFVRPNANFQDRREFLRLIYDNVSNWDPFKEYPYAGKIVPIDNQRQKSFFTSVRNKPFQQPVRLSAYSFLLGCMSSECLGNLIPSSWHWPDGQKPKCNDIVSFFRTILYVKGIISRPIYFEFKDYDGLNSHTMTEVWSEKQGKWLYFDPFYGAYSETRNIGEILANSGPPDITIIPGIINDMKFMDRKNFLSSTFADGWHWWSVPNLVTGVQFNFVNPQYYGKDIEPNVTTQRPPSNYDRKY